MPVSAHGPRPSLALILLYLFAATLWLAGGASRGDMAGQLVVRLAAWGTLAVVVVAGLRLDLANRRAIVALLAAALLLVVAQLVPLSPALWQALPGREIFAQAATLSGQPQPWRPWAIVPDAALNAAFSLVVPVAMLVLLAALNPAERPRLVGLLLALVAASTFVGLIQFSGAGIDNPLINETPGEVGGTFANRNHFALFVALGCLLAPVWAFGEGRAPGWRGLAALGLVFLFVLTILGSGSRAGMALGVLAVVIGLLLVQSDIRCAVRRCPRWVFPAVIVATVAIVAIAVLISIAAGRAVSIERVIAFSAEQDMRRRSLPVVLAMAQRYFPWGSGLGGFDPMFRISEPLALLKPTYFNHAHNDLLEVALDAGLPGLLLLAAALIWWAMASIRAWRAGRGPDHRLPKLGSAMLLLVLGASAFDYPARTPLMMAMIVVAAVWLSDATGRGGRAG